MLVMSPPSLADTTTVLGRDVATNLLHKPLMRAATVRMLLPLTPMSSCLAAPTSAGGTAASCHHHGPNLASRQEEELGILLNMQCG
ncbi:hypothetical protein PIB30_056395 [Stylosanthes scabra]|uniref:Uncharacterized protein n=1 Tax=Stylosanthes scabra TaxID=79078 RepID=A0ABU6WJU8_9FABA|nr:hypothetical protein [Stylosanthes scabra]